MEWRRLKELEQWLELARIVYRCRNVRGRGTASMQEFREANGKCTAIKISANNFGYDAERGLLTLPHYAAFLLADDLKNGTMKF